MDPLVRLPPDTGRILVIRLRRLGDTLLVTPVLRALRAAFPAAAVDVLVQPEFDAALRGNRHLTRLLPARRGLRAWLAWVRACRRQPYDAVFDLQASSRTALLVAGTRAPVRLGWQKRWIRDGAYTHVVGGWAAPEYFARKALRMAAAAGVPPVDGVRLELRVTEADRAWAAQVLRSAGVDDRGPLVAVSAVAAVPRKRWPPAAFAALADALIADAGAQVVFTHGPGQREQVAAVVGRMRHAPALWDHGPTTLAQLAAIYERCRLWIGNDGGPKHVATAAGCPTVTVIKRGDDRVWVDADDPRQLALVPPPPADPQDLAAVPVEAALAAARQMLAALGRR